MSLGGLDERKEESTSFLKKRSKKLLCLFAMALGLIGVFPNA
jgi:hypothetical protein